MNFKVCATINVSAVYINPVPTGIDKNLRELHLYSKLHLLPVTL